MNKYAIYCSEFEELWDNTYDNIDEAVKSIKNACTEEEILSGGFQIVEIKPVAKLELKIKLKYLDQLKKLLTKTIKQATSVRKQPLWFYYEFFVQIL